jgi:hypothetical protein
MIVDKEILCPQCGLGDQVEKVSTIYLVGIGLNRHDRGADKIRRDIPFRLSQLSKNELQQLSRRLKPPSSGKQVFTRLVHPDLYLFVFGLIIPFFLYGIWTSQGVVFWPVTGFLGLLLSLYLWRRKAIMARFERQQAERRAASQRGERAVGQWMALYYCARDDGVFLPGEADLTPVEGMAAYFNEGTAR